jgi:hypothetical protein
MKRLLIVAAAVAGISVTGLSGSASAGYPVRGPVVRNYPVTQSYVVRHGGYGAADRGCWGGYRQPLLRPNVCKPSPWNSSKNCNSYGGYFSSPWRW